MGGITFMTLNEPL